MAIRFRKSKTILPGVKLNFGKKNVGVSVGDNGVHYSVNSSGRKTVSAGIPGSGVSVVKSSGSSSGGSRTASSSGDTQYNSGAYTDNGYSFVENGVIFPGKQLPVSISKIKASRIVYLICGIVLVLMSFLILPIGILFMIFGCILLFLSHSYSNLLKAYNTFLTTQSI